uniref:G-protein coupled receptors family 1 profile domain-containing protein n=1 Tax=Parascaris equorum TaxID=6256 RepID=A0A914SBT4_PAREQ
MIGISVQRILYIPQRKVCIFVNTTVKTYAPVHGYICIAICTFGIITNLVHVLVLTRPSMRCSAVNCVLTAVAICDMGTMASYLIYICHFVLPLLYKNFLVFAVLLVNISIRVNISIHSNKNCMFINSPTYSHLWMQFLLWHVVLSIALHTTSLWLAVAMAFIRRMTLKVARLNSEWQRPQFAWRVCMGIYVVVFVLCIPTLLVHDIIEYQQAEWHPPPDCQQYYPANYTAKLYTLHIPESATANGCRFFKLNLWMSGVLFKVIPCILLHTNVSDRTTAMLICILIVFLITELPQGFLAILNAIYTTH